MPHHRERTVKAVRGQNRGDRDQLVCNLQRLHGAALNNQQLDNDIASGTASLNSVFREYYASARAAHRKMLPVVAMTMIGTGDIWRISEGVPVSKLRGDPAVEATKSVLHAIVGVFGWIEQSHLNETFDEKVRTDLEAALRESFVEAGRNIPTQMLLKTWHILDALLDFCGRFNGSIEPNRADFKALMRDLRPDLETLIAQTGRRAAANLMKHLSVFREGCSRREQSEFWFCVCGPAQGRRDNLEYAIAEAVFGQEFVSRRFFYLENKGSIEEGIETLTAMSMERKLGELVFDDPYRMWRDLFSDVSKSRMGSSFVPFI